jgi:hypothetical protein
VVKDSAVVMKLARDGEREVLIAVPESRMADCARPGGRGAPVDPARRGAGRPGARDRPQRRRRHAHLRGAGDDLDRCRRCSWA